MYLFLVLSGLCLYQSIHAELKITGVPDNIAENIEKRIDYKMRFSNILDERAIDQIKRETIEAIKPYGYFSPTIAIHLDPDNQHTFVDIALNQLAYIHSIHIEYTQIPNNPKLEKAMNVIVKAYTNMPFSVASLQNLEESLKKSGLETGYNDMVITRGYTKINKHTNLGNVTYLVTPNEKNLFGTITYPKKDDAYCLTRYHSIRENSPYNPEKLTSFQKNIMRSGLFSSSEITIAPREDAPYIQDIIIDYTPSKPLQYFLGAGGRFDFNEGKVSPQVQGAISINNLGGCGNSVDISLKGSPDGGRFHIGTILPQASGMNDFFALSASINTEHASNKDASNFFNVTALTQRYLEPFSHQLSINYLIENSAFDNNTTSYTTSLLFPKYQLLCQQQNLHNRFVLKAEVFAGAKRLMSDIDFMQAGYSVLLQTKVKGFYIKNQLFNGKIYTDDFHLYPLSLQFYLGGPDSNRGLSYHEIYEGKSFLLSRNQVQVLFKHNILIGGFFDTGYCTSPSQPIDYYPAAGLLTSYQTPYGNIEFSLGYLTNKKNPKWVALLNIAPGAQIK